MLSRHLIVRAAASGALAAGLLAMTAPAARAEDPVDLAGAYVVDTVGAITGREGEVEAALDALYDRAGIQLFVVYVDSFTGADQGDWATQTALANGLGSSDILLAIATVDRNFEVSVADDGPLSDAQLQTVEQGFLIPELREDNWADAAIAAAQGYGNQVVDSGGQQADGGFPVLPVLGGAAVVGVGALVAVTVRRRRREDAVVANDQLSLKDLEKRAGSLLVQLDDALKTSEQELGFAVAQFGDEATVEFTTALADARRTVAEAFTLRQRLDDAEPDTDAERREWTTRIIELCEAADARLDAQADAFDELRQLEKTAPDALAAVTAESEVAAARRVEAGATLARLTSTYSAGALTTVSDNLVQADKLLTFAATGRERADKAISSGRPSSAAIALRSSQAALGQVGQLFDALDTLDTNLAAATTKLGAAVADTTADITEARALEDGELTPAITAAEQAVSVATAGKGDPIAGLAAVERANASLEQVFTGIRNKRAALARAQNQLGTAAIAAQTQIASAADYITTRRGTIGSSARTRLSEAERHLADATALTTSDPVAALAAAQQASSLAASALQLARSDVAGWEQRESLAQGDRYGSDGADLGGIFGDWLLGGSGGGGGGGGGWFSGGSSSRSGSRSSTRRSSSRSFGGSSRSSSRSSGGRRSRGGRF